MGGGLLLGGSALHLGRPLGRAAGPVPQPPHVAGLREIEERKDRQAEEGREAHVRADALEQLHGLDAWSPGDVRTGAREAEVGKDAG